MNEQIVLIAYGLAMAVAGQQEAGPAGRLGSRRRERSNESGYGLAFASGGSKFIHSSSLSTNQKGSPVASIGNNVVLRLFRRPPGRDLIDRLRGEIVAAARDPVLFTEYAIEDSLEGRFEVLALHAALVLRRLHRLEPPAPDMAQDLTDAIFRSFETALRESGVGDLGLPKRMRTLAEAFLGRATAYDLGLTGGRSSLAAALARNVYNGRGNPERLARYVTAADVALANASLESFTSGPVPFPQPSAIP